MPLDAERGWTEHEMITAFEIHTLLSADYVLERDRRLRDGAPAERFEVRRRHADTGEAFGAVLGTVGIIASDSEPFCSDCRRTRITAEGKIMSCLFSREEFDLLGLLRTGARDDELVRLWQNAMWVKPRAHGMDHTGLGTADFVQPDRSMSAIGG
jgi:cyclic pyranopterin phosphate synthase